MEDLPSLSIEIRPLTPADEPFLWEMLYQAIYIEEGQPPAPREILLLPEIARYVRHWGKPDDLGWVALAAGEPVGAVWLRLWNKAEKGYGYIDETIPELSIATLPAYRGQGVGGRLMARLLETLPPRYPAVSLSVSQNNPAKRLYLRLGFRVAAEDVHTLTLIWRPTSV